jgi:phosphohistidine phosphatase
MEIFLVQHGLAMTKAEDPLRLLTPEGVESVVRIGTWACVAGVSVIQIRHSGKLRAEQTAQILAEHLKPSGGCINVPGLGPKDDVVPVGGIAANELANAMLVGHLPFLSRLAGFLVTGNPEIQVVRFCNAGIVCLIEEQGSWSIKWVMTPDLLL